MRRRANAGFTLLEVMLALAIVATTVFALLYMRTKAIENVTRAKQFRTSWGLLQQKVGDYEEVKIDDVKEGTESGSFEEDPGSSWERLTERVEMETIEKVDDDHPREMWKITLKVTQQQPDGTPRVSQAQWYRLLKEDDAQEPPPGGGGG